MTRRGAAAVYEETTNTRETENQSGHKESAFINSARPLGQVQERNQARKRRTARVKPSVDSGRPWAPSGISDAVGQRSQYAYMIGPAGGSSTPAGPKGTSDRSSDAVFAAVGGLRGTPAQLRGNAMEGWREVMMGFEMPLVP